MRRDCIWFKMEDGKPWSVSTAGAMVSFCILHFILPLFLPRLRPVPFHPFRSVPFHGGTERGCFELPVERNGGVWKPLERNGTGFGDGPDRGERVLVHPLKITLGAAKRRAYSIESGLVSRPKPLCSLCGRYFSNFRARYPCVVGTTVSRSLRSRSGYPTLFYCNYMYLITIM